MRKIQYMSGAIAALGVVIAACSSGDDAGDNEPVKCVELHPDPPWSYQGNTPSGPSNWGHIKYKYDGLAYPDCGSEIKQQSPIVISTRSGVGDAGAKNGAFQLGSELAWSSAATVQSVQNNGHTWVAGFDRTQSKLMIDDTPFELAQFHFHTPSEHTIDGIEYPLEAHFVSLNPTDAQPFAAVIAVMFEESANDNEELAKVWSKFSKCAQEGPSDVTGVTLDLQKLLPANRTYVTYDGSLTTPPCSSAVRFHILREPLKASKRQIQQLEEAVGKNNRPHQPILASTEISLHTQ